MRIWFGCSHKNTTFPITLPDRARKVKPALDSHAHHTYIACLDCGQELPYSWEMMKVLPRQSATFKSAERASLTAA